MKACEEMRMLLGGSGSLWSCGRGSVLASGCVFRLSLGNVYRGLDPGEREKLTGSGLMQVQAAVGSWDRPDGPDLEAVGRHPLNPDPVL